jgi:hypothetical protein
MSSLFRARFAAIGMADARRFTFKSAIALCTIAVAVAAVGGIPAAARTVGADPADPAARTAGVGYRSTIAPYTSMRPSGPAPWRERNQKVTPQPRPGGESQ